MEGNKKARPADKPVAKEKSKKPLIVTLIIAGALVLAGVGFAIWWFVFYSSDKQVLDDAFYNALDTTEGTADVKITAKVAGDGMTMPDMNIEANIKANYNKDAVALDIDGKFSVSVMSIDVSANLVANKNEAYIKVNDLSGLLKKFGLSSSALGGFDINKVSDKWIKISQDDLKDLMPRTEFTIDDPEAPQIEGGDFEDYMKCAEKATTALTEDKDVQKEFLTAIQDSKILTAKRVGGDKDGIKFQLTGDLGAASAFGNKLKEMKTVKTLIDCAGGLNTEDVSMPDLSGVSQALDKIGVEVYFWVSPWGHQPTRLLINVKVDEPNVKISIDVTEKPGKTEVKMPNSSTSLKSIIEDIQSSFNPFGVIN